MTFATQNLTFYIDQTKHRVSCTGRYIIVLVFMLFLYVFIVVVRFCSFL